jgi:hypothetical protein
VKPLLVAGALLVCGTAHADRCADGIEAAKKGDLPRASLYLESCTDEAAQHAAADVAKKLRASNLSALSISSTPDALEGETDALPGVKFTTPATIWTKAGTYKVTVAGFSQQVTVGPRTRTPVIINAVVKKHDAKDGKVDFTEDTPEQTAHEGPPPAVKHGSILPKKFRGAAGLDPADAGELEDPFAYRATNVPWRLGARAGADWTSDGLGVHVAAIAERPIAGPVSLAARLDFAHAAIDTIGLNAGINAALISDRVRGGLALRGEVRLEDTLKMEPVSRAAIGLAANVDVTLSSFIVGARFEQGLSETGDRALLLEAGYDF